MNLIDGKAVSASVKEQIRAEIERDKFDIGLAVIIVGNNQASRVYVNNKKKACEFVGFKSEEYALPAETTQEELLNLVETLNNKKDINGILVQLPLPKHLDDKAVIEEQEQLKEEYYHENINVKEELGSKEETQIYLRLKNEGFSAPQIRLILPLASLYSEDKILTYFNADMSEDDIKDCVDLLQI